MFERCLFSHKKLLHCKLLVTRKFKWWIWLLTQSQMMYNRLQENRVHEVTSIHQKQNARMCRHKDMRKLQLMILIKVNSLTAFSFEAWGKWTWLGCSNLGTTIESTCLRLQLQFEVREAAISTTRQEISSKSHTHLEAHNWPHDAGSNCLIGLFEI